MTTENKDFCEFCKTDINRLEDVDEDIDNFHNDCFCKYNENILGNFICHFENCQNKTQIINKNNFINYSKDFIFNKNNNDNDNVKYNDRYYHYNCLCNELNMNLICSECKIYCNDSNNMRDLNNKKYIEMDNDNSINVCIECFTKSHIRKCYKKSCSKEYVVQLCTYNPQCGNYSRGCLNCNGWCDEYCDYCR